MALIRVGGRPVMERAATGMAALSSVRTRGRRRASELDDGAGHHDIEVFKRDLVEIAVAVALQG